MDDFVTPTLSEHKDIHFYLNKFISKKQKAGGLYLKWRQMKCKPSPEKIETVHDGNLTSILSGTRAKWREEAKCAFRLNVVWNILVHYVQNFLPGYKRTFANRNEIYVAHLRNSKILC